MNGSSGGVINGNIISAILKKESIEVSINPEDSVDLFKKICEMWHQSEKNNSDGRKNDGKITDSSTG